MPTRSPTLADLSAEERSSLERKLFERQSSKCFICDRSIDLVLHEGELDIDHIVPLAEGGPDEENNFALTHAPCNRSKGASDLRVARRMSEFERLQDAARDSGKRGANLGDLLKKYGGSKSELKLKREKDFVEFVLDDTEIQRLPIYKDRLSGMSYILAFLPLSFLHHDDRINPRTIGSNIRGLIEEFMKGRPQLHVALAWWAPPIGFDSAPVKVFDGQHKAGAQILLGVDRLPVRIFLEPDTNVLLQANTNAGDKLRQVAFDTAVMRHLGSTLYVERVAKYKNILGLPEDDYSFSERDLVTFFKGEHREMQRYIIDAVRGSITVNSDNKLMEYVEWSGKSADLPLSYTSIERAFFAEFLYMKALDTPIGAGIDSGDNARLVEKKQMVRLMNLFAEIFFAGSWDKDVGGRQLESRLQKGDPIPEAHLRAWRVAREEILANILRYVRLVIENYYAYVGELANKNGILQREFPEQLWERIEKFLRKLAGFPCWIDKNLSSTVFGAKWNRDYWEQVFRTGRAKDGPAILAKPIDITQMIQ